MKKPFAALLKKMNSAPELPPVTCVVADTDMGFARDVVIELGLPEVQVFPASACRWMAYMQFDELVRRGIVPFKSNAANVGK